MADTQGRFDAVYFPDQSSTPTAIANHAAIYSADDAGVSKPRTRLDDGTAADLVYEDGDFSLGTLRADHYRDILGNTLVHSSGGTVTVAEDSNGRYNLSVAGGSVTGLYTLGVASYEAGAKQTTADSVEDSFSAPSNGVAKVYILDVTWGWYYSGSSGAEENWGKATLKFNRSTLAGTGTMFVDNGNASGRSTSSTWANITLPTNTYGAVCNLTPMNNRPTSTYFNAYVDGDTLRFQIATTDTALDGLRTSWTAVGYASDGTSSFSDRLEALEARAVVAGTNIVVSTVNGTSTVSTVASPAFTGITAGTGTFYQVNATTSRVDFAVSGTNTVYESIGITSTFDFVTGGTGSFTRLVADSMSVHRPHAQFWSTNTQAIVSATTTQAIYWCCSDASSEFTFTPGNGRITINESGVYLFVFSGISDVASGAANKHLEVWLAVNGTPITDSNTRVCITALNEETTVAVALVAEVTAGQYVEFMTWGEATTVRWLYTPEATGPTRPGVPSVIVTITKMSN